MFYLRTSWKSDSPYFRKVILLRLLPDVNRVESDIGGMQITMYDEYCKQWKAMYSIQSPSCTYTNLSMHFPRNPGVVARLSEPSEF